MTWTTRQRSDLSGLAAICAGAGPLVVLLHGVGLRAEAWNAQTDHLVANGFRVCAPDMPGHGQSRKGQPPESVAAYADRVAPILSEPTVVVGHSMGAMIALDLASRHNTPVIGAVALNGIYQRSAAAKQAVGARAAALDVQSAPDPTEPLNRWFGTVASPERDACAKWLTRMDRAAYKAAYTVFANSDGPTEAQLAAITCPSLFVTGSAEPNSTPEMSRAMSAIAPQGRTEIFQDAAHMLPMTHAGALNALLTRFATACAS